MAFVKLNQFGEINLQVSDYFEAELQIDRLIVKLDLNLKEDTNGEWEEQVNDYLQQIPLYKEQVLEAIREDFDQGGDVREYIIENLEGLSKEVINKLLTESDSSLTKEEQLFSNLKLIRIGFYPGSDTFAVWDFTIGTTYFDITDMLVVVTTYPKGEINYITWES